MNATDLLHIPAAEELNKTSSAQPGDNWKYEVVAAAAAGWPIFTIVAPTFPIAFSSNGANVSTTKLGASHHTHPTRSTGRACLPGLGLAKP
eukprot:scaffold11535_cov135-Isochrysis_galbana.AAC.6